MSACPKYIFSFLIGFLLAGAMAFGQSGKKDKLQRQKVRLQDEIELANKILSETKKNQELSLSNIQTVQQKLKLRQNLVRTLDKEMILLDKNIRKTNTEIDTLEKKIAKLKEDYARMIRQANKSKNKYSRLMFILSSSNFNQAIRRMEYLKQYSEFRRRQVEEINEKQLALNEKIEKLNSQKTRKAALKSQMEREEAKLIAEKEAQEKTIKELKNKESEIALELKSKQKEAKKIEKEIQRIIAAEIKRAKERAIRRQIEDEAKLVGLVANKDFSSKTSNKQLKVLIENKKKEIRASGQKVAAAPKQYSLTPEAKQLAANFAANRGRLPWPVVRGLVIQKFGSHRHPIAKNVIVTYNGIDIATEKGVKARSIFQGEVLSAVRIPGGAFAVIVGHGSYFTVYQNLSEVYVKMGDKVKNGQDLGLIYTDPQNQTNVHVEIWKTGSNQEPVPMDPLPWLSQR
tara:strand:- start:61365 stop:62738 length:1374 start_codon:yes stop_codon:yes gene_type:complete